MYKKIYIGKPPGFEPEHTEGYPVVGEAGRIHELQIWCHLRQVSWSCHHPYHNPPHSHDHNIVEYPTQLPFCISQLKAYQRNSDDNQIGSNECSK